jgi:hypothetical protein
MCALLCRYNLYIDCMPVEDVGVTEEVARRLLALALTGGSQAASKDRAALLLKV